MTRADLEPAQQAVQAAHALAEFWHEYPEAARAWHGTSNTLALLSVPDEGSLAALIEPAQWRGIELAAFREPDRGNELTALAIGPRGKSLCARLRLALP